MVGTVVASDGDRNVRGWGWLVRDTVGGTRHGASS